MLWSGPKHARSSLLAVPCAQATLHTPRPATDLLSGSAGGRKPRLRLSNGADTVDWEGAAVARETCRLRGLPGFNRGIPAGLHRPQWLADGAGRDAAAADGMQLARAMLLVSLAVLSSIPYFAPMCIPCALNRLQCTVGLGHVSSSVKRGRCEHDEPGENVWTCAPHPLRLPSKPHASWELLQRHNVHETVGWLRDTAANLAWAQPCPWGAHAPGKAPPDCGRPLTAHSPSFRCIQPRLAHPLTRACLLQTCRHLES